jgi:hypothetical protein
MTRMERPSGDLTIVLVVFPWAIAFNISVQYFSGSPLILPVDER